MCRLCSGRPKARMAQQRRRARSAATESFEDLTGRPAAAGGEDGVAEAASGGAHGLVVVQARVLERRERVGGEDFRKLVAAGRARLYISISDGRKP